MAANTTFLSSPRLVSFATASLLVAGATVAPQAGAEPFALMSYNVRGLPSSVIEDRTEQIAAIAPLLEDFHTPAPPYVGIPSFVGLQEVFDAGYYKTLFAPETITYPYITDKDEGGPAGIGDGLNLMSDFVIEEFVRVQWEACFGTMGQDGSDCDTNKGFTFARVFLAEGVSVDVYNLHADAGQDEGSREARRKNIEQLVNYIQIQSPDGRPVVVLGDTNSLYTRVGDDNLQDLLLGAGLTDAWVQLRRSGIVPTAGPEIDSGCATDPGGADCELVDKVLYRDGSQLAFAPSSYAALKEMFSDEKDAELSDHTPVAVTLDWAVVTTTTTTTSTSSTSTSSTSTSTIPAGACGDPVAVLEALQATPPGGQANVITASDALVVLRAAVDLEECAPCTCDVNNSGGITTTDALIVLKNAVGQVVPLDCPPC